MTPEYIEELAELADPEQLWRSAGLKRDHFSAEQLQRLNTGVALRRQAAHVRRLRELLGTGKSLLLTPLSESGTDARAVPTPAKILKRVYSPNVEGEAHAHEQT